MNHLSFLISLILLLGTFGYSQAEEKQRCNIAVKCSTEENPVYATTDDVRCKVYRNKCHLVNENCQRINRDEPEAKELEKAKCQKLCDSACSAVNSPVCGYYNEEKKTFANECEMDSHVCKTGKTYSLFADGKCPPTTAA